MLRNIILIFLLVIGVPCSMEVGFFAFYKYYGIETASLFAILTALIWTYLVQKYYEPLRNSLAVKMGGL